MTPPPLFPPVGQMDEENRHGDRRPINVSSEGYGRGFTPNSSQGGKGNGSDMTLERAQLHVNKYYPETVQKADPKQVAALEELKRDAKELDRIHQADPANADTERQWSAKERVHLAYLEGQLDILRERNMAPANAKVIDVAEDSKHENDAYWAGRDQAWQTFYNLENPVVGETRFHDAMTAKQAKTPLPTEGLLAQGHGGKVEVNAYLASGEKVTHTYKLDGDRVLHTDGKGQTKDMTIFESRMHQAHRANEILINTANGLEAMKANPSLTFKQGDSTYQVRGNDFVRTDRQGKESKVPLGLYEANLRARQAEAATQIKATRSDLFKDNRERSKITKELVSMKERGAPVEKFTTDARQNPTAWTLDADGKLQSSTKGRERAGEKAVEYNSGSNLTMLRKQMLAAGAVSDEHKQAIKDTIQEIDNRSAELAVLKSAKPAKQTTWQEPTEQSVSPLTDEQKLAAWNNSLRQEPKIDLARAAAKVETSERTVPNAKTFTPSFDTKGKIDLVAARDNFKAGEAVRQEAKAQTAIQKPKDAEEELRTR